MHVENKKIPRSKFNFFKLPKIIQELGLTPVEGGLGHRGNASENIQSKHMPPGGHLAPPLIPLYLKMKSPSIEKRTLPIKNYGHRTKYGHRIQIIQRK